MMYHQGLGVLADEATTLKWFGYAIEHADAGGWEDFIEAYINIFGVGVPKDTKIAFEWVLKSAEKGNLYGQSFVGLWYHTGVDVPQDYDKAMQWLINPATQGIASAQCL
ncbi:hypothetical protein BGZ90_009855, partial [Linnemannia elongata]